MKKIEKNIIFSVPEKDNQKSVHVCQSDPRTKEVMMTSSSHVTVHFSDFQIGESVGSFLLQYEGKIYIEVFREMMKV